jgi:hypothetical protein
MKGLPLAVVALASATRVAAQYTPNLIFNMTLSTMTGIWDWSLIENEAARDEAAGIIPWRSWYTGMEDIPQLIYGMIGEGVPWHYITAQYYSPDLLPSFIFSFPGTAWSLTGGWRPWNATSSDNDVEVRVDGSFSTLESPNINLGGQHGLSWSYHTVNYTIRSDYVGGGNMTVYNLTVTTGMVSDA